MCSNMHSRAEEDCRECGGLGWLRQDLPVGHKEFGKLKLCSNPAHSTEREAQYREGSGLKPHERLYTLDGIMALDETTPLLIQTLRRFLDESRGWLYLYGGPGNGKTLALMAAVNEFIRRGRPARYTTMADLYDLMRATCRRPAHARASDAGEDAWHKWETYQRRFERAQQVPLLAIDEFDAGKVNETDFAVEFRARLIDHRYRDAIAGKTCTIFAGNDDPALLPGWIYDRVRDNRFIVFENTGPSVRPAMEW
jgi:DNA replication protein DnaC